MIQHQNYSFSLSVITITKNDASTIRRTIESVINQSITANEYIIIDGGSTDGTIDIIKEYISYLTHFISEPDDGISDALNKAINIATGSVISIIHSDDWYTENAFATVRNIFHSKNPSIIHSDVYYWLSDGSKSYKHSSLAGLKYPILGCTVRHPSCFVKSDLFQSIGLFDTSLLVTMDYDFLQKCYFNNKQFFKSPIPLANYSEGGASSQLKETMISEERKLLRMNYAYSNFSTTFIITIRTIYLLYFDSIKNKLLSLQYVFKSHNM